MIRTTSIARRTHRIALALAVVAWLGGCGGGTSQVDPFVAQRVLAFGDETSALTMDGRKYGVNALAADMSIDCVAEPIWVQAVANLYGLVFAECNPGAVADPGATSLAAAGAQAADLSAQVDVAEASPGFAQRTIATVLIGANDVLALYAEYPTRDEADLTAELAQRGAAIAAQVNRLVDQDVRVLIATVPDVGLSPFALAEKAAYTDTDRAALLTRLTTALNESIRVNIVNDGRKLGLVLGDDMVRVLAKFPSTYSLSNVTEAACGTVLPPDCVADGLVTGATSASWLWAGDRSLAYGGQRRLGDLARSRALNNPF